MADFKYPFSYSKDTTTEKVESQRNSRPGWLYFFRQNRTVPIAFFGGIACTVGIYYFTFWLSNQILRCPTWAINCSGIGNIGLIQGLVTAVYAVGLAAMAYTALSLAEAALWPIMHMNRRSMTVRQMETYLNASRGSKASAPFIFFAAQSLGSVFVVVCIVIVAFLPLLGAPGMFLHSSFPFGLSLSELY